MTDVVEGDVVVARNSHAFFLVVSYSLFKGVSEFEFLKKVFQGKISKNESKKYFFFVYLCRKSFSDREYL